jgi:hypothetical protein
MSRRGLVIALLCGVLGVGLGAIVAYAAQPRTSYSDDTHPMSGVSPSVPIDEPTHKPYRKDIPYPTLEPGVRLSAVHTITNQQATWTYHVPEEWQPYWVCSTPGSCPPGVAPDDPMTDRQVDRATEVRYRPSDEPTTGGYSLRVRILDNDFTDLHGAVAQKVQGFRDSSSVADFHVTSRGGNFVDFEYRDAGTNFHRFNFFQWFAVPGQTNATLEMSVSGRKQDVDGLKALFDRFADNATGTLPPPPSKPGTPDKTPSNADSG